MANVGWIAVGIILFGVFFDMEINESRFDFRCDVNTAKIDKDFIRGKCFEQYEKRYNKLSIPLYGFVIVNFLLLVIVCVIYSQFVKLRINELETSQNATNVERQILIENPSRRKLFTAYCCQLATRFCLGILFIVLLQTQVAYPRNSTLSSVYVTTESHEMRMRVAGQCFAFRWKSTLFVSAFCFNHWKSSTSPAFFNAVIPGKKVSSKFR